MPIGVGEEFIRKGRVNRICLMSSDQGTYQHTPETEQRSAREWHVSSEFPLWSQAGSIFTLPPLPEHSRLWNFFRWLPCLVFYQDKQRTEICFPVCFCWMESLNLTSRSCLQHPGAGSDFQLTAHRTQFHWILFHILNPNANFMLPSPPPPTSFQSMSNPTADFWLNVLSTNDYFSCTFLNLSFLTKYFVLSPDPVIFSSACLSGIILKW